MQKTRKIIGFLINILLGFPMLYGLIFAMGMASAATTPEFVADLPIKIIKSLPILLDESYGAVINNLDEVKDDNAKAWLQAMDKSEQTPRQFLEDLNILPWLQTDVTNTLKSVGEIMRGTQPSSMLVLNFELIKQGFEGDTLDNYFNQVLAQLPPCDYQQTQTWQNMVLYKKEVNELPACKPTEYLTTNLINSIKNQVLTDLPKETKTLEQGVFIPTGIDLHKITTSALTIAFIFPIIIILLGSFIATSSFKNTLKWAGLTIALTGLIALTTATIPYRFGPTAVNNSLLWEAQKTTKAWTPQLQKVVLDISQDISSLVLTKLFQPVISTSLIISAFGLLIFSGSYLVAENKKTNLNKKTKNKKLLAKTKKKSAKG